MKLATLSNGRPDGQLVVVSRDLKHCVSAGRIAANLREALDGWAAAAPALEALADSLDAGAIAAQPFDPAALAAPLPRTHQLAIGSAYPASLQRVLGLAADAPADPLQARPVFTQAASDCLSGPRDPILVPADGLGLDFGAGLVVVLGPVPMRPTREQAGAAIRLVGLCNDFCLRRLVARDLESGHGFFHSRLATSFAPVLVTPNALGKAWDGARLSLPVDIELNGRLFGRPDAGADMAFDFIDLIQAAAETRRLGAGTIIGTGIIANRHDEPLPMRRDGIGYAALTELRAVEKLRYGKARTPFLAPGDRVSIGAFDAAGRPVFGLIDQTVEPAERGAAASQ